MSELAAHLSAEQREAALEFDRPVIVSAAAGAGKTGVLVTRLLVLLAERRARLDSVVAITFTRKAAAEMVERLRGELLALSAGAREGGDEAEAIRLAELAEGLETAAITTVHGFAADLLRRYPAAAGVDPRFRVLDEVEAASLRRQAVTEAVRRAVNPTTLEPLLAHRSPGQVIRMLIEILDWADAHGTTTSALVEATRRAHQRAPAETQRQASLVLQAHDDLRRALEAAKPSPAIRERVAQLGAWRDEVGALMQAWASGMGGTRQDETRLAALDAGRWVKHHQAVAAAREAWIEAFEAFRACLVGLRLVEQEEALLAALEVVAEADRAAREAIQGLSFADLEQQAARLLARPDVAAAVAEQVRHVLVDELQDTSRIQWEIIRRLSGLGEPEAQPLGPSASVGGGETVHPRPSVFFVGDPGQSIYRFRGAAVEVFEQATRAVQAAGGRHVRLATNYRSQPGLIRLVDHLFADAAEVGIGSALPHRLAAHPAPVAEWWIPDQEPSEDEPDGTELLEAESRCVAERIAALLHGPGADWPGHRARPKDIAVLFRAATHVHVFERALREMGIPTRSIAHAFFERAEVTDLLSAMRAADRPGDQISLAAFLRSPLVGLSDRALLRLARSERGDLGRALAEAEKLLDEERQVAVAARHLLDRWRRLGSRLGAADLLDQVLADTGFLDALRAQPQAGAALANVRRLRQTARAMRERGIFSLPDFLSQVEAFVAASERHAEAPMGPDDAVALLTVHRAKGLEWPVVILADLPSGPGGLHQSWLASTEEGLCLRLHAEGSDSSFGSQRWRRIQEVEEAGEEAEFTRLFYVALTRARDRLIIVDRPRGPSATASKGGGWPGRLRRALQAVEVKAGQVLRLAESPEDDALRQAAISVHAFGSDPLLLEPAAQLVHSELRRTDQPARAVRGDAPPAPAGPAGPEQAPRLPERVISVPATALSVWRQCPRRSFFEHVLRMPQSWPGASPPEVVTAYRSGPSQDGDLDPLDRGTAFHRACQLLLSDPVREDRGLRPELRLGSTALDPLLVDAAVRSIGPGASDDALAELMRLLERTWSIPEMRQLLEPGGGHREVEVELPFSLRPPSVAAEVIGRIDLLVQSETDVIVYDFKTDRIEVPADADENVGEETLARHAEPHLPQLLTYALACRRAVGGGRRLRVKLVFARSGRIWEREVSDGELREHEANMARVLSEMVSLRAASAGPNAYPGVASACPRCPYQPVCVGARPLKPSAEPCRETPDLDHMERGFLAEA